MCFSYTRDRGSLLLCRVEAFNVELCPVLRLGAITTAINLAIALRS
ncbi:hypothetical protein APHMUC_0638 [Anaplasma phagocytophilum str. ApMUC09]|uniref:Uncharacterized protein n=1 Tax=Anaplasma phagocytophilum str. ApMUC09 TaxID=1359152 RepID=A0A0F3N8W7_ANAPH|nr:hypothetical protein APHMUC_0638 [Anaplasma phagocytophilum str. ApMUC09]